MQVQPESLDDDALLKSARPLWFLIRKRGGGLHAAGEHVVVTGQVADALPPTVAVLRKFRQVRGLLTGSLQCRRFQRKVV
jgi:hypothetical protein